MPSPALPFTHLPSVSSTQDVQRFIAGLQALYPPAMEEKSATLLKAAESLWAGIASHSPYLSQLLPRHWPVAEAFLTLGATEAARELTDAFRAAPLPEARDALMRELRQFKQKMALLTALADLSHHWNLEQVTAALSDTAELTLRKSLDWLLLEAKRTGWLNLPDPADPSANSGLIVLGMGKLGARELNYSSDIDLVLFYTPAFPALAADTDRAHTQLQRLGQELVELMQARTADGYVFRMDLRLRPDPGSTPIWMKDSAGLTYYETVGQNWERCAYIKARAVAGDLPAGETFLDALKPYIWRKYLDFTAIADIESIRRQIDDRQARLTPDLYGHNIKLGAGGIRDIEFFVQTQQLIWGGRQPALQRRETVETLHALAKAGIITTGQSTRLERCYQDLRRAEHALQMLDDAQTHSLPADEEHFARFAGLLGFANTDSCRDWLRSILQQVQQQASGGTHAKASLAAALEIEAESGERLNLVFTGVEDDPDTLTTLSRLGYREAPPIAAAVRDWHRGKRRATRTTQSRAQLTEAMPALLKALAETPDPDATFQRFDRLLQVAPSGMQLISLLYSRPPLLGRVAGLLGSASNLAETLLDAPHLMERLLAMVDTPTAPEALARNLEQSLTPLLDAAADPEEALHLLRQHHAEARYQAGVEILGGTLAIADAGRCFTDIAEVALRHTLALVEAEFRQQHGEPEGGRFAIAACGKLGSGGLTFQSDLDLVFVYDAIGQGDCKLSPEVYYNRLAQRIVTALTALMRYGRLYEVDTRLRPHGKDGPMASRASALLHYLRHDAWAYELMAYTVFRPIAGHAALQAELLPEVRSALREGAARHDLPLATRELIGKIAAHLPPAHDWDVKYLQGGLLQTELVLQCLILSRAADALPALPFNLPLWPDWLRRQGALTPENTADITQWLNALIGIQQILRLCQSGNEAPRNLQGDFLALLRQCLQGHDLPSLHDHLNAQCTKQWHLLDNLLV